MEKGQKEAWLLLIRPLTHDGYVRAKDKTIVSVAAEVVQVNMVYLSAFEAINGREYGTTLFSATGKGDELIFAFSSVFNC